MDYISIREYLKEDYRLTFAVDLEEGFQLI